jgi:S-adenosylmethionine:tRNA ribosyltransferase-isomerase
MREKPQQISIADFDYMLPDGRIAKFPLPERDASKLLLYHKGDISQTVFKQLAGHLPENAFLVRNNTRVVQARLFFFKETGARIEVFCLEPHVPSDYALAFQQTESCEWNCMVGNLKKWKQGVLRAFFPWQGRRVELTAEKVASHGLAHFIRFKWNDSSLTFGDVLDAAGQLPIPPYLNRETEESDKTSYQTVYARVEGSVAAPTAGLHFTENVLDELRRKEIPVADVTLHVGAGTFQPVKAHKMGDHPMHIEMISVTRQVIESLLKNPGYVVAVGTTSVRTLESLYFIGRQLLAGGGMSGFLVTQWEAYDSKPFPKTEEALTAILNYMDEHRLSKLNAATQIIIAPGYEFHIVKGMITNFHQPHSTLLLLIAAFVGDDWRKIYDYALEHDFRFLSYGDSSLLLS